MTVGGRIPESVSIASLVDYFQIWGSNLCRTTVGADHLIGICHIWGTLSQVACHRDHVAILIFQGMFSLNLVNSAIWVLTYENHTRDSNVVLLIWNTLPLKLTSIHLEIANICSFISYFKDERYVSDVNPHKSLFVTHCWSSNMTMW